MPYCICNFKTYNTLSSIQNIEDEAKRENGEYNNVDHTRTHMNEVLLGDMNYTEQTKKAMKGDYYTKPDARGRYHSEAKVKGIGVVLTYSPEAEGTFEREKWIEANIKFLKDLFPGCPISAISHCDEKTFHIQAFVTPLTKEGKISKNSFLKGKGHLVKIQDEYAERMKAFGLERGVHRDRDTKMKNVSKDEWDTLKADNKAMKKTIENLLAKNEKLEKEVLKYINHITFDDEKPVRAFSKALIEESTTEREKVNLRAFKSLDDDER